MKGTVYSFTITMLIILVACVPVLNLGSENAIGTPTRAPGEEMTINVTIAFDGPLAMDVTVEVQVHSIVIDSSLTTADDIRDMYTHDPGISSQIEEILRSRAINLTMNTFQGDDFEVISGQFTEDSLDENISTPGEPVIYTMKVDGATEITRFLDEEKADLLEEGRENVFISSLFMSGFVFQRTISLIALEGEVINYRIPTSMDPIGDAVIELDIRSYSADVEDGHYLVNVDGSLAYAESYFTFEILESDPISAVEESIEGDILVDWNTLYTVGIDGDARIGSISTSRSDLLSSAPLSMTVPPFIPASLIRYSHLEGILTDADIDGISDQLVNEVENTLREALSDPDVQGVVDIETGIEGLLKPGSGSELLALLSSDEPISATIGVLEDSTLDILKDYEVEDVMGLLNGGLRIYHDLDPINDDRFTIQLKVPPHIMIMGDTQKGIDGDRRIYDHSYGRKLIGSDMAKEITRESLSISGTIDISQVRSMYVLDIEIDIEADITFGLGAMAFDSEDVDLITDLEYELDYLSSDMIRLLMDMGMVDHKEIEDKIEKDLSESMEDLLPDDDDSFTIDLVDDTLVFDGDLENMTGDDKIELKIVISGTLTPKEAFEDDGEEGSENAILPFHIDPILPVRRFERSIALDKAENWDIDLKISIPSGIGLKAWLGKGGNSKVKELDVDTSEGYPTIHLDIRPGEADHVLIQLEVGSFLLINNIGACFGCCVIGLVILLLILLLIILKIARKKKAKKDKKENKKGKDRKGNGDENIEHGEEKGGDKEMSWDDDS